MVQLTQLLIKRMNKAMMYFWETSEESIQGSWLRGKIQVLTGTIQQTIMGSMIFQLLLKKSTKQNSRN